MDWVTILQALQAIASEIELDGLLSKVISVIIQQTKAHKGCLLFEIQGQWLIAVEGIANGDRVRVRQSLPLNLSKSPDSVSTTIIDQVARTQQRVVLSHLTQNASGAMDSCLNEHHTHLVLYEPLIHQGKLIGICYLAHESSPDAFSAEQVEPLNWLATQAAISIEHARLVQLLQARCSSLQTEIATQSAREDNHDPQRIAVALHQKEQHYAALIEASPIGVFHTNPDGDCLYVNQRWCEIAGLTPAAAMGNGWIQGLHPDDRHRVEEAWSCAVQNKVPFRLEYRFQRPDNASVTWVLGQAVVEKDIKGEVIGYVGTITDISDRKQAEEERQQAHYFLQTVVDYLPLAIFVKDGREEHFGELLLWNKTSEIMFGLTVDQAIGKTGHDLFPTDQADFFYQKDRAAFEHGVPEDIPEEPIDSYSLGRRLLRTVKTPLFDDHHQPQYLLCYSEDITERKRAQTALQETENRFRQLADNSQDVIYRYRLIPNRSVEYINPKITALTGYTPGDFYRNSELLWKIVHPEDLSLCRQVMDQSQDDTSIYVLRWLHQDGRVICVEQRQHLIRDPSGALIFVEAVVRDLTPTLQLTETTQLTPPDLAELAAVSPQGFQHKLSAPGLRLFFSKLQYRLAQLRLPFWTGGLITGSLALTINVLRHQGVIVPIPVLLLVVSTVLSASIWGLRGGLTSASMWILYVLHLASDGYGAPGTLIGGPLQISLGILIIVWMAILQGKATDHNRTLTRALRQINQDLDRRVAERTQILSRTNALLQQEIEIRERTTTALRQSENKFRAIFDQTFQFMGLMQTDGTLLEANQTALDFAGLRLADVIEKPFWETYWWTISPQTQAQLKQAIAKAARGEFVRYEVDVLGKSGQIITIDFSIKPVRDDTGQVVLLIPEGRDISLLKAAEAELQYQISFDQLIASISTRFINLTSTEISGGINQALQAIGEFTQIDASYIFLISDDQTTLSMTHEWIAPGLNPQIHKAQDLPVTAFPWGVSKIHQHQVLYIPSIENLPPEAVVDQSNWRTFNLKSIVAVPMSYQGTILGWVGFASHTQERTWTESNLHLLKIVGEILTNALQRKKTEKALSASEKRYALLAEISPVAIFRADTQWNWIYVNQRWCEISGLTYEQSLGNGWLTSIHPEDQLSLLGLSGQAQVDALFNFEYRVLNPNGRTTWVVSQASAEYDDQDNLVGYVGTLTDITDRKQAEAVLRASRDELDLRVHERTRELSQANANLEAEIIERQQAEQNLAQIAAELQYSNQELAKFAYAASHDLQEPLRTMAIYAQLLDVNYRDQLDHSAQEYITQIIDWARRMQQLVQDLLAYSRVERLSQSFASTDCNQALQQALDNLQVAIADSHAVIIADILPTVNGDSTQLVQLWQNLISNAVKFCREDPPQIKISVELSKTSWCFRVSDNGIGIKPQYLERIFEVFKRLHTAREFEGTGMGLAICKKIVERHGGQIWAESQLGEGTKICFTIPTVLPQNEFQ